MRLGGPPKPPPLPAPRPTAPPPERTAKAVVTGRNRKKTTGSMDEPVRRSGTRSLRIARTGGGSQGGNLNL